MHIREVFNAQREFFERGETLSESFRRKQLIKLRDSIKRHEEDIYEAVKKDLNKSEFECYETEIGMVLEEISYMLKNLHRLMKTRHAKTPLAHFPSTSRIYSEPYGCVLIMSPWNYPLQLALSPLAGAIAAGNCAIVKPSNYSPSVSAVIRDILSEAFPAEYIYIALGGRDVNSELLEMPFDYIFFTGGQKVGRLVMEKAAANLTPVTLELGGKSPCIVDETADIPLSARRIIWGKLLNAGQTCVAPDYILVHENVKDRLIEEMIKYSEAFYGADAHRNEKYPKIINKKHFERLSELIEVSNLIYGGKKNTQTLQIAPAFIEADWNSEIMKDEIFGPLIPFVTFKDIKEAAMMIKKRPKPLALYLFTSSAKNKRYVIGNVSYGGGCVNDTIVHLATPNLPFGGVGASGMGSYHGEESFKTFSHRKSVLEKGTWLDLPVRYPPSNNFRISLLKRLMK